MIFVFGKLARHEYIWYSYSIRCLDMNIFYIRIRWYFLSRIYSFSVKNLILVLHCYRINAYALFCYPIIIFKVYYCNKDIIQQILDTYLLGNKILNSFLPKIVLHRYDKSKITSLGWAVPSSGNLVADKQLILITLRSIRAKIWLRSVHRWFYKAFKAAIFLFLSRLGWSFSIVVQMGASLIC